MPDRDVNRDIQRLQNLRRDMQAEHARLRETLAEAYRATRELREVTKAAQEYVTEVRDVVPDMVTDEIDTVVVAKLEAMGATIADHMRQAVGDVYRKFDRLSAQLLKEVTAAVEIGQALSATPAVRPVNSASPLQPHPPVAVLPPGLARPRGRKGP